jgi:hypothetical protein
MIDLLTAIMWIAGSAFALLAAVGVLRMPDVFTRMQASTKASTLGLGCLLIGAALQLGDFASLIRVVSIGASSCSPPLSRDMSSHARRILRMCRCGRVPFSTSVGWRRSGPRQTRDDGEWHERRASS